MGMGNDGIEVYNSLDTCTQINNSGIRDVNSQKSINDMKNENAMGNITSTSGIDSNFSGATENCPDSRVDSNDINNAALSSTEEQNDGNYSQTTADELLPKASGDWTEKTEDNTTLSQDSAVTSENNDASVDNKTVVIVEDEYGNAKSKKDIESELTSQTETTPALVYRNESLLRVSYLKRDWGGKRVSDIRSVSDLLETFYSLEEPIIMPLPRQRDYYDQWARTPRGDVIQRLYPRTGSSVSTKCWALFQTIQSDQGKSNSNPTLASSTQRLAPPSNGEVMCDSLDSIIEHYNHFLSTPPVEAIPNTPTKTTTQRVTASQTRANSGGSKISSCGGNRGTTGTNNATKQDGTSLKAPGNKSKTSGVPCGGKMRNAGQTTNLSSSVNETESAQSSKHRAKKSHFPDYELCSDTASDSVLSNVEMFDISTAEQINKITSSVIPKSLDVRRTDEVEHLHSKNEAMSARSVHGRVDLLSPMSIRENRDTITKPEPDSTYLEMPPPSGGHCDKDDDGNACSLNTNTLSLSLPYERAHTVAGNNAPPTANLRPKSNLSSPPHQEMTSEKMERVVETHERFPLRSTAFISRGKRANTTIDFSHSRTRLKHLTRSIPTRAHRIHDLKDSLLIHEINCDKSNDQQKWDHSLKRRPYSNQRTQPLKHECRPSVQLPVRMHSMLEHRLSPTTSAGGHLSPEDLQTPSRRHSAVSLASVHFLDLADLKNLLKRSNTTMHYL